jgi:RimJ/RimL family protein N-acetyltransferase
MRKRQVRAAVAAVVAVLALTAAAPGADQQHSPVASARLSAESSAGDALLPITPREGRKRAEPGAGISVTVSGGTITSVTAMASGVPVEGRLRAGGTAWHSMWALQTNTRYAVSSDGSRRRGANGDRAQHLSDAGSLPDVLDPDLRGVPEDVRRRAAFQSRDRAAFIEHESKIKADPSAMTRTIVAGGGVVGSIGSWEVEGERDVGFWIGRGHWGNGYATAALREFLDIDLHRPLHAHVADHNVGSRRVLEKCGFVLDHWRRKKTCWSTCSC